MKVSNSVTILLKRFSFVLLALTALVFSSCESVNDSGGPGYYSQPTLTPIEGASMMQNRLGEITRSQIR